MNIEVLLGNKKFNMLVLEEHDATLELTDDELCSFKQFTKIVTGNEFNLLPQKYTKMSEIFVSSSYAAPLLIPREDLKASLAKAEDLLKSVFDSRDNFDYLQSWLQIKKFLDGLHRAKIDAGSLRDLISARSENDTKTIESFLPARDGFARPIKYNMCGTVTGRLTVESGPHVLTAHHSVRNCIRSSYQHGKIYYVDFTSMEPRIAMIVAGKRAPEDVYNDILEEFPDLSRESAKLVLLTALYGGQPAKIAESIGDISLAKKALSFVRSHFDVPKLERNLADQAESGIVKNALGRPLREAVKNQRVRTNYFLQSSAAELSILLFSRLCSRFPEGVKPLFVIHDALIVDVSQEVDSDFLSAACGLEWSNSPMPVKVEVLSHN